MPPCLGAPAKPGAAIKAASNNAPAAASRRTNRSMRFLPPRRVFGVFSCLPRACPAAIAGEASCLRSIPRHASIFWRTPRMARLPAAAAGARAPAENASKPRASLVLPALHRPFELGRGHRLGPHQLVRPGLELNEIGRGKHVLPRRVELDAAVAHHQLLGLEVGLLQRLPDLLRLRRAGTVDRFRERQEALHVACASVVEI